MKSTATCNGGFAPSICVLSGSSQSLHLLTNGEGVWTTESGEPIPLLKSGVTLEKARELVKQLLAAEQTTCAPESEQHGSHKDHPLISLERLWIMKATFALLVDHEVHNVVRKLAVEVHQTYRVGLAGS